MSEEPNRTIQTLVAQAAQLRADLRPTTPPAPTEDPRVSAKIALGFTRAQAIGILERQDRFDKANPHRLPAAVRAANQSAPHLWPELCLSRN
ncbi:hypothetical protein SBV1_3630003 [Verrucomicrobia bacterium]|nr:hypothetical protein SBV1_3630003 [Verrucomicrobiota bacterium]